MALLATQHVSRAAPLTNKSFANCAAGGDTFSSGDDVFLEVKNTDAAPVTVTVVTPGNVDGLAVADFTFTVAATTGLTEVGPFPSDEFGKTASITYSAVTALTIAVKKMGS